MNNYNFFININKAHFTWALLIFCLNSIAQSPYNLVSNYSFEQNYSCGSSGGGGANYWESPTVVTNFQYSYANACSVNPCCGVPSNTFGYGWQYARTGVAYTGILFSTNDGSNTRFYLQTQLIDSLKSNRCYYIEFFVNLFNYAKYANNNISLLVGDTAILSNNINPAYANPQILQYGNPCITDTLNWVKVGGIYLAHGGEKFITIGNFTDDFHTDSLRVRNIGGNSSYNIDDVSVIPLDSLQLKADAGRDTTIIKGDSVWIGSRLCGLQNVVWYDAGGNVIDTGAPGLWVKPTANTFYIIEQNVCGQYSRDTVNIMVAPLPVVIKSYTVIASAVPVIASAAKQSVSNQWETSTEINTAYYNIQRSTDGLSFYTLGKVMAKGAGTYTFNDPLTIHDSRLTKLYYRLEIVDKDDSKTYSEIRSVNLTTEDSRFTISPNPSKDFVVISGGNIKQIKVNDISGRTLLLSKEKKINISGLINGVYFVSIETMDGNRVVEKLLKMP